MSSLFCKTIAGLSLSILAMLGSQQAEAAVLNVDQSTGQLLGAYGVDVDGTLYNVSFLDGSCVGLFNGCDEPSDFAFGGTGFDGTAMAAEALLAQVFVDGPQGNFDSMPSLTAGCTSLTSCSAQIPGAIAGPFGTAAVNAAGMAADSFFDFGQANPIFDTATNARITWAVFTPTSPVPLPPAVLLLLAAIATLAGVARRRAVAA